MNQSRTKQHGFGAVEIIIICLVVVVIGAAGFFVFKKTSEKAATAPTPASQDATSTQNGDISTKATIDHSEGGKYLVIKECGVRVLLPNSLKGNAFYSLREFDEIDGRVEAASINSKFFQPECRDTAEDLGLDVIRTATRTDNAPYAYKRNALQAGNYSYHNIYGKEGCSKFLSGAKADVFNELKESIGTVESY
jgi:hypothetical protein